MGERRDAIAAIIGAALLSEAYRHTMFPNWTEVIAHTVEFADLLITKLDETGRW